MLGVVVVVVAAPLLFAENDDEFAVFFMFQFETTDLVGIVTKLSTIFRVAVVAPVTRLMLQQF